MKEVQHPHQHPDVAAGDDEADRGLEQLAYRFPVRCDHGPFLWAPRRVETPLRCRDSHDVPLVDEAYNCHRVFLSGPDDARPLTGALQDGIHRSKSVIELDEVELLQLVEDCPVLRISPRELAVAFEHVEPATVQLEIDAAPRQEPLELLVV
jgi:hypothetical protein